MSDTATAERDVRRDRHGEKENLKDPCDSDLSVVTFSFAFTHKKIASHIWDHRNTARLGCHCHLTRQLMSRMSKKADAQIVF
jgi:hypothetical protein